VRQGIGAIPVLQGRSHEGIMKADLPTGFCHGQSSQGAGGAGTENTDPQGARRRWGESGQGGQGARRKAATESAAAPGNTESGRRISPGRGDHG
jgi:hypothetical protein